MASNIIFDFNKNSNIEYWTIVDDVVMGGKSSGRFKLNSEGHGVFEGSISLDNNGGFSSVHYKFKKLDIKESNKIILNLITTKAGTP